MNIFSIPLLLSTIIGVIFAAFLIFQNMHSKVNILFAFEWLSTCLWWFGYFMVYSTNDANMALFWAKVVHTGVTFIPIFMHHFVMVFLGMEKQKRKVILFNYIYGGVLLLILWKTNYLIAGLYTYSWGYYAKAGFLHYIFIVYFFMVFLDGFIDLNKKRMQTKKISSIEAIRISYVFWFFAIALLGGIDFIGHFGVEIYPIGFIFVIAGLALITYAILRHRLLDVNIAITRAGLLCIVYALVLGVPFLIGAVLKSRLYYVTSSWWIIPLFLMAILASSGPFIYMKLQRRVESRLRAEEFKAHGALRRLSHNMLRFTNLDDLLKLTVHYLVKVLQLKFTAVYLLDESQNKYVLKNFWQLGEDTTLPQDFPKDSLLAKELIERRLPMVTEEMKLFSQNPSYYHIKELVDMLANYNINTVIPSFLRNNLQGIFVLSDRRKGMLFTQEDLNLLMVLSNEAALAIENAQFHQKEKSMLVEKSRRDALADMAPGASHQFNNRLVAISSSAELSLMKLEGIDLNGLKDDNLKTILGDVKAGLEMIDKEVYKGKEITSAILKHSKAKREFQELDLVKLIDNAYKLVQISHAKVGLNKFKEPKFSIDVQGTLPLIYGSEALLQDSFFNLIDNAFDAINEKYTMISKSELVSYIGVNFQGEMQVSIHEENQKIIIELKDNGIGLKQENVKKLFTPYFTTKATSGKGTGLGLYVIREFVEAHSGIIACDSKYTEWTMFTITIPVKSVKKVRGLR